MEKVDRGTLEKIVKAVHVTPQGENWCEQADGCQEFDATFYSSPFQQAEIAKELIALRSLAEYMAKLIESDGSSFLTHRYRTEYPKR